VRLDFSTRMEIIAQASHRINATSSLLAPRASSVRPLITPVPIAEPRECMVCLEAPRCVRFACGHLVCCASCTDELMETASHGVPKNACPVCRARIEVINQQDDCVSTFRQPEGEIPGPLLPKVSSVDTSRFVPGELVALSFRDPGLTGLCLVRPWVSRTRELMHTIQRVVPGSSADEQGTPPGGVIVEMNGQSVTGHPRAEVLELAQRRPLTLVVRVPTEADWPPSEPEPRPALQAMVHSPESWLQVLLRRRRRVFVQLPPSIVAGEVVTVDMPLGRERSNSARAIQRAQFTVPSGPIPNGRLFLNLPRSSLTPNQSV